MADRGVLRCDNMAPASGSPSTLHKHCPKCREYFELIASYPAEVSNDTRTRGLQFHNIQSMIQASRNGCHLCTLVITEMSPETKQRLSSELQTSGNVGEQLLATVRHQPSQNQERRLREPYEPILRLEKPRIEPGALTRGIMCEFKFLPLEDELEAFRLTKAVQPSTCSWETFSDIHHWLRRCESTHTKCIERRRTNEWHFPTRLLYVAAFGAESNIYLRESSRIPPDSRYITLSHCWGPTTGQKKLLTAEYASYVGGISASDLPQTFRDTVGLAKSLGIEYLWIDSLCIIQDSPEDWAKECTLMSDVYNGSFLNIAANCSTNSQGGLFRTRNPLTVTPFRARMSFAPNGWVRKQFVFFPYDWDYGSLHHAPLSKRAWVVQERLLAPRTVHFLKHKVVWECSSLCASESDVEGAVKEKLVYTPSDWATPSAQDYELFHREASCLWKWNDALKLYTHGNLSHESDKLIAISGVARYLKQNLWRNESVQYYAGLWSYQIEWQLLWHADGDGNRAITYRAPSWSWASYNGKVACYYFYKQYRNEFLAKVLETHVETVGDPFGSVRSGYLKIRGPLCKAMPVKPVTSDTDSCERKECMTLVSSGIRIEFQQLILDEPDPVYRDETGELVLLGVVKSLDLTNTPMMGLVLKPTLSKKGEYTRVGFFDIYNWVPQDLTEELLFASLIEFERSWGDSPTNGRLNSEPTDYIDLENAFSLMDLPEQLYERRDAVAGVYEVSII